MLTSILFLFYIIAAYLIGSISSAIIVCRLFSLPDPRTEGSHNPGATNVLRIAGVKYGIIVLVADILKGLIPVAFAHLLGANTTTLAYVCLAAVFGHMYPLFFKFKGGKGVATALGALLGFHWLVGLMAIATWLVVALISRYSSLASVIAIVFSPFYAIGISHNIDTVIPLGIIVMFVVYKHHANITRLIDGEETKITFKRGKPAG